ncbi:hypothetical protein AVDCRST_MAG82-2722 [uncultured Rubrobacteraceae bacterium]|uniref:Uncharacterized protein n=1 Tax=uncultured Rubrobacteraceae bacterium TaxID=349277 RepID=A0A6J4QBN8_9ACTN|nr:hypothetical protein AVDCRST_MAG82-2722 [uncultured Rubrobacteraceae bacterium]
MVLLLWSRVGPQEKLVYFVTLQGVGSGLSTPVDCEQDSSPGQLALEGP